MEERENKSTGKYLEFENFRDIQFFSKNGCCGKD